mmetsp:Transcript_40501/g.105065  ORF Transcript_40501/g.105065 Transcript_40501/m.105065 type:complete len:81 (+) Transcript_40501:5044-5286(+)
MYQISQKKITTSINSSGRRKGAVGPSLLPPPLSYLYSVFDRGGDQNSQFVIGGLGPIVDIGDISFPYVVNFRTDAEGAHI